VTAVSSETVAQQAKGVTGLSGIRVLDLGRYIAAPYCAALLADQGAEVIRIEAPEGAPDRDVMPIGLNGRGALYMQVNRNKKSLSLDIASSEGRRAFERLVAQSDVVVVNLAPAALKRAGLDYDSLKALRSDIILTTISALGFDGDAKDRIGFDGIGQALSGSMHLTGSGERPMRAAVSYVDYSSAISAAFATVSALYERTRNGRGQHVQASLLGSAVTMTNPMLIEEASGARRREPLVNRSPIAGPSDLFAVLDGWVMVQVIGNGMFARWACLMGREDLINDPRFASDLGRGENGMVLSAIMADWCADQKSDDCLAILENARIPGCPALTPEAALRAPEISGGGFFRIDLAACGPQSAVVGLPVATGAIRTAAGMANTGSPAPELGMDSDKILADLGYGADKIRKLTSPQPVQV
jgi:crotonobetainyl-CoA:carnitine CoA-transferase CaiB-like acyl-CoA transferase